MHAVGQSWVAEHQNVAENGGAPACQACHGTDYRGTVLSRSKADRVLATDFGTKVFWTGFQIGCYTCHNGPSNDQRNANHAPLAAAASASTTAGTAVAIPLAASDADGDALVLRIVSQPRHGTVGLTGTTATYYPEPGFAGSDMFTFAAWDGATDSNLAAVTVGVATDRIFADGFDG